MLFDILKVVGFLLFVAGSPGLADCDLCLSSFSLQLTQLSSFCAGGRANKQMRQTLAWLL